MRCKVMQVKANKERRIRLEEIQRNKLLKEICDIISSNRTDFEVEIHRFLSLFKSVEQAVVKYDEKDQDIALLNVKSIIKECNNDDFFKMLKIQIEKVSDEAVYEFFCGIDFFNLIEEISDTIYKLERIMYIWKAQTVIKNIKYQFERIWNSDNKDYQIAVLKGMLALY